MNSINPTPAAHALPPDAWLAGSSDRRRLDAEDLSIIAMMAGLYTVTLYASRVLCTVLYVVFGTFYAQFLQGVVDEGLGALLVAVTVVLAPKPGAAGLLLTTVTMLNAVLVGTLGISALAMATASFLIYEFFLAAAGLTFGQGLSRPAFHAPGAIVARLAIALGLANAVAMAAQYALAVQLFRFYVEWPVVVALTAVVGFGYSAIGAAVGARLGYRLRRTAP